MTSSQGDNSNKMPNAGSSDPVQPVDYVSSCAWEIDSLDGPVVVNINTCGGSVFCPFGKQDSLELGLKLEERLHKVYLPARMHVGVYGCGNHCAENFAKDIGIIGMENGWDVFVGGHSGRQPKYPWLLARGLDTDRIVEAIEKIVVLFRANYKSSKKISALIESIGIEEFRQKVLGSSEPPK